MVLVLGFLVLAALVVWAVDLFLGLGPPGLVVAVAAVGLGSLAAYWKSDAVALAMSHARPADPRAHARLHNLVEGLCVAAGLPKPRVYVVPDPHPNAFAAGRSPRHAAVAVTTGLLEKLNRIELEGVLAHELSHVKSYDILVSTLAVTFVGIVAVAADFALRFLWWGGPREVDYESDSGPGIGAVVGLLGFGLLLLAPLAAQAMRLTVSRRRELLADVSGVGLTRYPPGLIAALEKLKAEGTVVHTGSWGTSHLWTESPLARRPEDGRLVWLNRLFETHPPLDERIQALKEL